MRQSDPPGSHAVRQEPMCSRRALRSNPPFWLAAAPLVPNHATGHYVSDALALCHQNRTDADAVQCAIATAYYTVGSLFNDEQGSPYAVDSKPELVYELGVQKMAQSMRVYQNIAQYKAQFSGTDLRQFAFNQVSRVGQSRYITAASSQHTDTTHGLADYYGFKTGELVIEGQRNVTALRIDGADELDWLLTLGAVVRTEDGESLRKGDARHRPQGRLGTRANHASTYTVHSG
jgi:hypothetical protein